MHSYGAGTQHGYPGCKQLLLSRTASFPVMLPEPCCTWSQHVLSPAKARISLSTTCTSQRCCRGTGVIACKLSVCLPYLAVASHVGEHVVNYMETWKAIRELFICTVGSSCWTIYVPCPIVVYHFFLSFVKPGIQKPCSPSQAAAPSPPHLEHHSCVSQVYQNHCTQHYCLCLVTCDWPPLYTTRLSQHPMSAQLSWLH